MSEQDLSRAEIDAIVYACRQAGDDSTYAIVRAALRASAPQGAPIDANKIVNRWMGMIEYAYQCRDDIRDSSGNTPRSYELRLLADEMRAAMTIPASGKLGE